MASGEAWSLPPDDPTLADVAALSKRDYMRRLGATIIELRRIADMSQAVLAERVGIAEATLSRWEGGKTQPKAHDLMLLADALQAPADILVNPPPPPRRQVSEVEKRLAALRAFDAAADGALPQPEGGVVQEPGEPRGRARE